MHLSAAILGVDARDIQGNSTGFADFRRQRLTQDRCIGPLLHFRGKIHGVSPALFVTLLPYWKWNIRTARTGFVALYGKHRLKCKFVEIVILWLTRCKAEPCCVQKTVGYFCLLCILLLDFNWKLCRKLRYNLGVLSIMLLEGGTVVAFSGKILALGRWNLQMSRSKCPGVPRGQPPGWPLISA